MNNIKSKLLTKSATLGVIGLGYVGLPLAVEKAKSGLKLLDLIFKNLKLIW